MSKIPTDCFSLLRIHFNYAARMDFIDDCLELIDKSRMTFGRQPGLHQNDLAVLSQESMSPMLKYYDLNIRFAEQWGSASASQANRARCLGAGVIVYERGRQAQDWLDCFATFDEAVTRSDLDCFPPLNVRRAVKPDLYDRIIGRRHPIHVRYALNVSDRAFGMVKNCERYLRHISL